MVKGFGNSRTACTAILVIPHIDATTCDKSQADYFPVTERIVIKVLNSQRDASRLECP